MCQCPRRPLNSGEQDICLHGPYRTQIISAEPQIYERSILIYFHKSFRGWGCLLHIRNWPIQGYFRTGKNVRHCVLPCFPWMKQLGWHMQSEFRINSCSIHIMGWWNIWILVQELCSYTVFNPQVEELSNRYQNKLSTRVSGAGPGGLELESEQVRDNWWALFLKRISGTMATISNTALWLWIIITKLLTRGLCERLMALAPCNVSFKC